MRRQKPREKARTARHVIKGELRSVVVHLIAEFADVARIVKQRSDQRHDRALGAEAARRIDRALVPDQQPRHRERHVERMLTIVIDGVDAVISGHASGEQALEFFERNGDPVEGLSRPAHRKELAHRLGHCRGGTYLDGIRNVEIVTA